MYDYNNGMNENHDTQNAQEMQNVQNTQPQMRFSEQQPPKKPRTHRTGKIVALVCAIAVLCGGAGFGGAFAANKASQLLIGASQSESTNSNESSAESTPSADSSVSSAADTTDVLNTLQSGVVDHTKSTAAERNSDGTYAYTRDLVSAVKDSIVYIEVYVNYRGQETLYGSGSGIIISRDGYIITNAHVAENEYYEVTKLVVNVNTTDPENGTSVSTAYEAQLLGSDTDTDLAVLKIKPDGDLAAAALGDSDKLSLGDDVVVIGNPLGLETSVSKGIVSGLNRQVYDDNSISAIQTDTAINSGNSGGGLFNMYGEVVGVVNMKLVSDNAENLGFAITINDAKSVINDLITKGYVTGRPILGITCVQVSDYVGAIRGMTPGLVVTDIDQSMAIAKSGLVVGDTITAINGTDVRSVDDVSAILQDKKPGDTVTATVVRTDSRGRDKSVDIEITLSEYTGN